MPLVTQVRGCCTRAAPNDPFSSSILTRTCTSPSFCRESFFLDVATSHSIIAYGLVGSQTGDNAALPLSGLDAAWMFGSNGNWAQATGSLTFGLIASSDPYIRFEFSFTLLNPAVVTVRLPTKKLLLRRVPTRLGPLLRSAPSRGPGLVTRRVTANVLRVR